MRQQTFFRLAALALLACSLSLGHAQLVRFNEIIANNTVIANATNGAVTDMVELYNTTGSPINISSWTLTDTSGVPRYVFPPNSIIPALSYHVINFDSQFTTHPPSWTKVPFGIKASGGFLFMYDPFGNLLDAIEYGLQLENFSIGRDGGANWVLTTPTFGSANIVVPMGGVTMLKINEWLADQTSSGPEDYFEIYNATNKPVALQGLYLFDSTTFMDVNELYQIAPLSFIGTGALAYVKFVADGNGGPAGSTNRYPADRVNFKLTPSGTDNIVIFKSDAFTQIDVITVAAGQEKNVSEGRLPDGAPAPFVRFRKLNDYETRSPGEQNYLIFTNLYVNEVLTHTDLPLEDAVEFQNRFATNIDISGWWLSNSRADRKRYQIPAGPVLAPAGFRVIYEGFNSLTGFNSLITPVPFTFNSARGDNVVLSQVDAGGKLTGYIAYEEFEAAANGVSFGHYRTSLTNRNDYKFVAMSTTTFGNNDAAVNNVTEFRAGTGASNSYPKVGPIVINEIMYAPAASIFYPTNMPAGQFGQDPDMEFIEFRSISPNVEPLYDPAYPTNHWKLQKAVSFIFPLTNVAPNSFFLVVGFNPHTNTTVLANFRSRYNVPSDVAIFGPWSGRLTDSTGGDSVELYRPDPVQLPPHPDAGFVPYVRVDKVNYNSTTNWPSGANSTGNTLQRKVSNNFGNDPINWAVNSQNAGRSTPAALLDTDGDGMSDGWENANGFNPNNPTDAGQDADGDGFTNLAEFLAGSNPHDAASYLRVHEVIPFQGTNVAVRFLAYSNASYSVQFRNSLLPSSNWQKVDDVPVGNERMVTVPDLNAWKKADRYYRVVAPATN